jgi:hypothetical protein
MDATSSMRARFGLDREYGTSYRRRMRPVSLSLLLFGSFIAACGGPTANTPTTPKGVGPDATSKSSSGDSAPHETPAARPLCEDSACFTCGDGICPVGYYCERSKKGAPLACASAAKCAEKPTCACLKPLIAGCSCEDKQGGPLVQCE